MTLVLRIIKNKIGNILGYGKCKICGDSWYWKKPYQVKYKEGFSAFPYCEECNKFEPVEMKLAAAYTLFSMWMRNIHPNCSFLKEIIEDNQLIFKTIQKENEMI